jgi:hypothetical protein
MMTVLFPFIPLDPDGMLWPAGKEHLAVESGGVKNRWCLPQTTEGVLLVER